MFRLNRYRKVANRYTKQMPKWLYYDYSAIMSENHTYYSVFLREISTTVFNGRQRYRFKSRLMIVIFTDLQNYRFPDTIVIITFTV